MAHKPYMPLYISEYLSDTAHFSTLEHGAYLLLIMTYWQTGKPLPNNDKQLAAISRLSVATFKKIRSDLISKFVPIKKKLVHKRVEKELEIFREKSELARLAGQKSAEKRWGKKVTDVKRTLNGRSTDVQRTCNQTEAEAETKDLKFKNCSKAAVIESTTSAGALAPAFDVAAAANFQNVKNYFLEQSPAFFPDLPTTLKFWSSPKLRGMLSAWAKEEVTLEDVQAAVEHQRSKDNYKPNPYYYADAAIEFARERKKFGKYRERGAKSKQDRKREEADRNIEIALQQSRERRD